MVDGLPIVRLIQEPVKLGGRGAEPTNDLALGEPSASDALLGLEGQPGPIRWGKRLAREWGRTIGADGRLEDERRRINTIA